jgi:arylsulfatase A-like enzyme
MRIQKSIRQTRFAYFSALALSLFSANLVSGAAELSRPNFVVIYCDNLGYGDIGCFGSKLHRTPHIDRMAREGRKFTSFYVSSGVCTPSRASLMTACYPRRVNMHISDTGGSVLRPISSKGLNPNEVTIAEVLKQRGYATAIIGKWHLGDQPALLPTRQGFDYYFGIPYSDDMTPRPNQPWPPLPLLENEKVIEAPVDRNLLTKRTTEKAIEFIERNKDKPFFLYFPQTMPGSTRAPFSSENFRGKSANGPYGDSVEEIDWSTGELFATLKRLNLDEKTLVIWTSDNGAPRRNPPQGRNTPLGGWGYTTMEGGMRVPCVIRWPGKVPAGTVCDELSSTMDLFPTFAKLAGAKIPDDRILDGKDIWPLVAGKSDLKTPHDVYYYYHITQLQAVRSGKWKLHLSLTVNVRGGKLKQPRPLALYDLQADIGETNNLAEANPDVVARLEKLAEVARVDLGDVGRAGQNQRAAGTVANPKPLILNR